MRRQAAAEAAAAATRQALKALHRAHAIRLLQAGSKHMLLYTNYQFNASVANGHLAC
jgi:hypothetical protein